MSALFAAPPSASANVDVSGVHGEYDACIAKFTAAGLRGLVNELDGSKNTFKIRPPVNSAGGTVSNADSKSNAAGGPPGTGGTTNWDPNPSGFFPGPDHIAEDGCSTLYHEMRHLADYNRGTNNTSPCYYDDHGTIRNSNVSVSEVGATRAENTYRASQHLDQRSYYGTNALPPPGSPCVPPPGATPPPPSSGGCNVSAVGCRTGLSFGDPHIVTLNGYRYELQAAGEFILSRSTDGGFEVQTRTQAVPGRDDLTLNTAVAIKIGTHRLALYAQAKPDGDPHPLRLDGAPVAPTPGQVAALPGGASISTSETDVFLQMASGERLTLHAASMGTFHFVNVSISVPPSRAGKYIGILGDGSGNPRLDLRTRDGHSVMPANTYGNAAGALGLSSALPLADTAFHAFVNRTFADSWRVSQSESLFDYAPGTSTRTFTDRSYPRSDFRVASDALPSAIAACRAAGVSAMLLAGCAVDMNATGNSIFATALAHVQSVINVPLASPVNQLRALIPSAPALPNLPSLPHF